MRMSLILLLMIFSSCQIPMITLQPQERCVLSLKHEKCRCHKYDYMIPDRVSDSIDHPLEYCENLVGNRPEVWGNIKLWFYEYRLWREDIEKMLNRD